MAESPTIRRQDSIAILIREMLRINRIIYDSSLHSFPHVCINLRRESLLILLVFQSIILKKHLHIVVCMFIYNIHSYRQHQHVSSDV